MFKDVSLQPPEHVRAQHIVKLLDLVLLGDVGKLLQEDLQFAAERKADTDSCDGILFCENLISTI